MSDSPRSGITRETRMLLIVITLSAIVLVVLSRFRFPDNGGSGTTAALPLERLAARATYDELATIIAELGRHVSPQVTVLRVETAGEQRFVPALRVRSDLLLAHVTGDSRIHELIGLNAPVDVAAFDAARDLVLLRVPSDPLRVAVLNTTAAVSSRPRYVAAAEGTPGGPALRPVFLGRTDRVADERYTDGKLVLGGVVLASPGSFLFTLDGSFLGLCLVEGGYAAGVTARGLQAAIDAMLAPGS